MLVALGEEDEIETGECVVSLSTYFHDPMLTALVPPLYSSTVSAPSEVTSLIRTRLAAGIDDGQPEVFDAPNVDAAVVVTHAPVPSPPQRAIAGFALLVAHSTRSTTVPPAVRRARDGARKTIRISVSPWARCWCVHPAGVQAIRLAGTIDVPRSVRTARTPVAAYTRCPRACDCTALAPPDGQRCRPPDGHTSDVTVVVPRGWR
ncbi:hypothetical protein ABZ865_33915 [Streptomyces sp. NPDC047085]|uniref:hypothetical protein n=1 Tax=Streptomyces sp. NPDC047085 TaxID=3155140 RepID=UPI00340A47BB